MSQLPTQRRERLLTLLRSRGALRVREVAAELGVSQPTVRRDLALLAERGLITRAHGGAVAVNARRSVDRGQSGSPSWVIGMVAPSLDYYFPAVAQGAKAVADAAGARLVLRGSEYDPTADREQVGMLIARTGVHGLLIAPELRAEGSSDLLRWLDSLSIPVVLVERQPPLDHHVEQLQWVASDHRRGGAAAVEHLHAQGHRWIGMFGIDNITGAQVAQGWRAALSTHGIDPTEQLSGPMGSFHRNGARSSVIDEVVERVRQGTLTALIVQPDPDAIALLQRCSEAGIRVPQDLAVVAYDDEVASMGEPALTAVRPAKHHVGRMAMEVLLARLRQGAESPLQQLLVRPQLAVRESSVGHIGRT
ncbi:MAG TPA: DeoR/GlpR family transcriptional regulator [Candidatus Avipropionibacterium avicola]|uniref:DeoR/GlpR family transcriptional regulator n=1 Tax=Candidatus Avipropionibacterium avicola TaxID=2840701 RepID=A0A9D1GY77_9ACTN|nr:DeoR/GlpR family transcriptional regulator [Candidatus Avipropionibacterium avicola]